MRELAEGRGQLRLAVHGRDRHPVLSLAQFMASVRHGKGVDAPATSFKGSGILSRSFPARKMGQSDEKFLGTQAKTKGEIPEIVNRCCAGVDIGKDTRYIAPGPARCTNAVRAGSAASKAVGTERPSHAIAVWRTLIRSDMGDLFNCEHSRLSFERGSEGKHASLH